MLQKHEEEVKKKFRSYEELKKAMEDLHLSVKTEGQIVTELESELKQKDIAHDRLKIVLLDLEYYLHQVYFPTTNIHSCGFHWYFVLSQLITLYCLSQAKPVKIIQVHVLL